MRVFWLKSLDIDINSTIREPERRILDEVLTILDGLASRDRSSGKGT